jgi:hypothetical protein
VNKISASILLVAFAALFIEAIALPSRCQKQGDSKCAVMMKTHLNCKMMAEMMKKHDQKKGKCNPGKCNLCPLFAVATFRGIIRFSILRPTRQTEYSVMLNPNLSDYHSQQWKPPNKSFI